MDILNFLMWTIIVIFTVMTIDSTVGKFAEVRKAKYESEARVAEARVEERRLSGGKLFSDEPGSHDKTV